MMYYRRSRALVLALMLALVVALGSGVVISVKTARDAEGAQRWRQYIAACEATGGRAVDVLPVNGRPSWQCIGAGK